MIPVPDSGGLELHVLERRAVATGDSTGEIPAGTRSVSLFLVNDREPARTSPIALRVPGRARGRLRAALRPAARPARRAGGRLGRAGRRSALRRHPGVRDRPRRLGRLGDRRRRVPDAAHAVDPERRGRADGRAPSPASSWRWTRSAPSPTGPLRARRSPPLVSAVPRLDRAPRGETAALAGAPARDRRGAAAARRVRRRSDRAGDRACSREDPDALDAFRVANRAVASALRRRLEIETPAWRPFQLAFLLLNLPGLADPDDPHRETVDLLYFPTGGGKTEAYLGLAAFAIVLRRLRHPAGWRASGRGRERRHALHAAAADARPARACRGPCLRARARARGRAGALRRRGRSRSACGSGRPRRRTSWAARATGARTPRASRCASSRQTRAASRRRSRSRSARGAATRFEPELVRASARRRPAARAADRLHEPRMRLHRRPAAADRGRRRAALPAAPRVPDRDRRQVRGAAVGRAVRRAARRRRPLRRRRLLRRRRAGQRHAARRSRCRRPTSSSRTSCT